MKTIMIAFMGGAGIAAIGLLYKAWVRWYNGLSDEEKKAHDEQIMRNINDDYDHHRFV